MIFTKFQATRPVELNLFDEQVHVWRARLDMQDANTFALAQTLTETERTRAQRIVLERDRKRFITRRGMLRTILGRYLDIDPTQVEIQVGEFGKPFIESSHGKSTLQFNLSHSNGCVVYSFARRQIGIDLECIRPFPTFEDVAASFFSARENSELRTLPRELKLKGFFNCWTRKEAYLKALGSGLSQFTDSVDVSLVPETPQLIRFCDNEADASRWTLSSFAPIAGYVASLVVEGNDLCLSAFDY